MYAGVGFGSTFPAPPLPDVPTSGPDYGIGFFTPGTQLLVQTSSHNGAVLIPANGFTEPTTITVYLRPDTPNPFDGTGFTVVPPFYEITASNLSNTHYLANGTAVVGFCLDETVLASLADPAIAHIAVAVDLILDVVDVALPVRAACCGCSCSCTCWKRAGI